MLLLKILIFSCMIIHRARKHFCRYCLPAFRAAEKLKCHIKELKLMLSKV